MSYPIGSREIGPEAQPGQARIRRSNVSPDVLVTEPQEGIHTVYDILQHAARTYPNKDALGWRDIENVIEEEKEVIKMVAGKTVTEKKTWKYFQLSPYRYITFAGFRDKVATVASGLASLGIAPGAVFNVYAGTTVNWQLMSHACASIGVTIATAYETLGEEGLKHSLSEPDCVGVFTNPDLLPTLSKVIENTPTVKTVIYDDKATPAVLESIARARPDVKVLSLEEVLKLGSDSSIPDLAARAPKREDLVCIMYTSGTTGSPKGVMLTHANIISAVGAVIKHLGHRLHSNDFFLAFLPLAHILEYVTELSLFYLGMTTGYGKIKTLTDASVRNCQGDIGAFRPTLMVGVPAVWEAIRKGVLGKVNKSGVISKAVFHAAYTLKKNKVPLLSAVADAIVFSKVRAQTGGRLRLALCGGAALSHETQEFLSVSIVTVLQGYGMTESCGMCTVLTPDQFIYGSVGTPMPSIEIKLVDVPEANYLTSNSPQQGEVWIRGPSVTGGYFKRDDLNKDPNVFTPDGWFRTGDVGQWNVDGTLTIIDRIKNLVKLQGGEYIALERLESIYKSCQYVANICVHAVPDARQPMALVFPHEANLRHALITSPPPGFAGDAQHSDLSTICADKSVQSMVLKECNAVGKSANFKTIELLEAVVLTSDEWTPESGLVTPAQKLQRRALHHKYKDEIAAAYSA
ncbi:long-chain-fatty-acid-CoA-ligase [Cantharellus anzutake]|uniref:long-chain-fatty-acid-CoA-ligase n=1 Tax=Cantharellus anzutake TaxID=1750568 RepID=UPI001907F14C|nr:long-chain-fatty-acid-CoA-ligase [Cantharellus anzutake]KAF8331842.1 long-chain-fatty-acid-CoA-ligase [Cantharellus anzutake]